VTLEPSREGASAIEKPARREPDGLGLYSMDGLKLAHFVKDRWPPIKIMATSGHAKMTANDLPEGGRFLPKPYKATEIADAIRQLILAA